VLQNIATKIEKLWSGKKLSPQQRMDIKNAMQTILRAYDNKMAEFVNNTVTELEDRWLDATVYIPPYKIKKYASMKPEVQDGLESLWQQ
jgi:hypothetical protein